MDPEIEECRSSTETLNASRTSGHDEKSSLMHLGDVERARRSRKCGYMWYGLSYLSVILVTALVSTFISAKAHIRSECSCSQDATFSKSRMGALDAAPAAGKPLLDEAELQKAWDTLAEQPDGVTVVVTEDFGYERGLLPESPRVTRNGTSGFLVTLDSMHQAHCVDAAWRRLWFNHEDDKTNGPMAQYNISDEWYQTHITHCLKILKQSVLCKMNMDMVMGYMQLDGSGPSDFIHFEKNHICKNYTDVLGWIKNEDEDD